ncbi:MAG: MobA/MobL family protein, partial [Pseudomonadota bacterium]|nr:MobA/MobL family protein [Pseudomonadota bacterium]
MSIYHLSIKTCSRAGGQSAAAKSRYVCRLDAYERGPRGHLRDAVLETRSGNMPSWAREASGMTDAEASRRRDASLPYWEACDRYTRSNGRLCTEVEFALPIELSREQQIHLVELFVQDRTTLPDGGKLPYTWAMHRGGGRNPHVHLLVSDCVSNDGFERGPEQWFKRAAAKGRPPEQGGVRKTTALQHPDWLRETRELWANAANHHLALAGRAERIDHRSNATRGIDELPGEHVGWGQRAQRARAANIQRGSVNVAVRRLRAERAQILNGPAADRAPSIGHNHDRPAGLPRPGDGADRGAEQLDGGVNAAHRQPAAGLGAGGRLADPAPVDARANDEPRPAAATRGQEAAHRSSLPNVSGRYLDERGVDAPGVLHAHARGGLVARGADGRHELRWQGASVAREGGWVAQARSQAPSKGK